MTLPITAAVWMLYVVPLTVWGQAAADAPTAETPEPPPRGFWPTPEMIEGRFRLMAERVADRYELDDDQYERLESMLLERWPVFLDENKQEIQGFVGEMIGARMRGDKPSPDRIADFGRRVMPLFQKLRVQIEASTGSFRDMLRPEQRVNFDADFQRARVGLDAGENVIRDMQKGIFDPPGWRERFGRAGRNPNRAGDRENGPGLDDWQRYTERFIRRYRLDEAQKTAALAILDDLQGRRRQREVVIGDAVARLRERIAVADDPTQRTEMERQLADVQAPIQALADELHRRLDALLTDNQRAPERDAKPNRSASRPAEIAP